MIVVENAYLSDDVAEEFFVCNLESCKGACCVEGDAGAPLEKEEIDIIEAIYEEVKPYMDPKGIEAVEKEESIFVIDDEGDYTTTTINNRECAFAVYDDKGILGCSFEKAHNEGVIAFKKPISCHLYPIRITKYEAFDAVNYHRWDICNTNCKLGKNLSLPIYIFLKDALIRKYGAEWYQTLEETIKDKN